MPSGSTNGSTESVGRNMSRVRQQRLRSVGARSTLVFGAVAAALAAVVVVPSAASAQTAPSPITGILNVCPQLTPRDVASQFVLGPSQPSPPGVVSTTATSTHAMCAYAIDGGDLLQYHYWSGDGALSEYQHLTGGVANAAGAKLPLVGEQITYGALTENGEVARTGSTLAGLAEVVLLKNTRSVLLLKFNATPAMNARTLLQKLAGLARRAMPHMDGRAGLACTKQVAARIVKPLAKQERIPSARVVHLACDSGYIGIAVPGTRVVASQDDGKVLATGDLNSNQAAKGLLGIPETTLDAMFAGAPPVPNVTVPATTPQQMVGGCAEDAGGGIAATTAQDAVRQLLAAYESGNRAGATAVANPGCVTWLFGQPDLHGASLNGCHIAWDGGPEKLGGYSLCTVSAGNVLLTLRADGDPGSWFEVTYITRGRCTAGDTGGWCRDRNPGAPDTP
jgi:hypothetical protein